MRGSSSSITHLFHRHLPAAFFVALAAAALTIAVILLTDLAVRERPTETAATDDLRDFQRHLEARIALIEAENERARSLLEDLHGAAAAALPTTPFPLESVVPSIVQLICLDNGSPRTYYAATGVVIDVSGLILTSAHALSSADGSAIAFCGVGFTEDLRDAPIITHVSAVVAVHSQLDLALLRLTERLDAVALPRHFPAARLADAEDGTPLLGETVFIGGYPGVGADTLTFTQGVVSGRVGPHLMKTTALIDSGASGGPVLDASGTVIGAAAAAVQGDIGGSLGYFVSAGAIRAFLDEYRASVGRMDE